MQLRRMGKQVVGILRHRRASSSAERDRDRRVKVTKFFCLPGETVLLVFEIT